MPTLAIIIHIVFKVLGMEIKEEKGIKRIQIGKEEVKLSLQMA